MKSHSSIDAVLRDAVDSGAVAGVVCMATDADGNIYEGAFGRRGIASDRPMTPDTVFWIASMTKAITGAACMQLVEQGRIGLDDDCGRIVPALAHPNVLEGFDEAGNPRLRPAQGAITLRRLLTHTAGFVYDMWNANMRDWSKQTGFSRIRTFQDPTACAPLGFDPGTRWEYGLNIDWAGKVLETLTGETIDEYTQKNICGPLGMTSTGYMLRPEIERHLAGMHRRKADGTLEPMEFQPPQVAGEFLGGGGLYGTAGDYMRFVRMMLRRGELEGVRVLKPETVALMGENHIGDLDVRPLPTAIPETSNPVDFLPGIPKKWGLTFMINMEDVPGRRKAGSLSWAGLRNTYYWIDGESGIGGTIMTQITPFADPKVLDLYEAFERSLYHGLA